MAGEFEIGKESSEGRRSRSISVRSFFTLSISWITFAAIAAVALCIPLTRFFLFSFLVQDSRDRDQVWEAAGISD